MSTPEDMMRARLLKALDLTEEDLKAVNGDPDTPGTYAHARRAHAQEREAYMTLTEKLAHRAREREQEAVPTSGEVSGKVSFEHNVIRLLEEILAKLTARGGLCAPVTPYYGLRDAMPKFSAERGGICYTIDDVQPWERKGKKRSKGKKRKKG